MLLVGWTGLLVPSLIRSIEPAFEQTDAGIGVFFFVFALASRGGLDGRRPAHRTDRTAARPAAGDPPYDAGLSGMATVPTWGLFLALAIPFGLGSRRDRWRDERAHPRPVPGGPRPGAQPAPPVLQPRRARLTAGRGPAGRGGDGMADGHPRDGGGFVPIAIAVRDRSAAVRAPRARRGGDRRSRSGYRSPSSHSQSRSPAMSRPRSVSRTGSSASSSRRRSVWPPRHWRCSGAASRSGAS